MAKKQTGGSGKKVTRYTYDDIKEPRTPETGHTSLLPAQDQVVTLPMDNGWSKAIHVGKLPQGDERLAGTAVPAHSGSLRAPRSLRGLVFQPGAR